LHNRAVRENNIKRVVNISGLGAGAAINLGTVTFVGTVESIFNQTARTPEAFTPTTFEQFTTHKLLKHILTQRSNTIRI
jgi:hypothetical protein